MMPVLQLGPLAVPIPAISVILGIWLGLSLAERHAHRFGVNPDQLFNLALIGMIAGVIAGRLTYVARYFNAFTQNPLDIFSRNLGLFDPLGGIAFGALFSLIYAYRKGMDLWLTLDALTPAMAVLALAIGLAHLASGATYGAPTELPWGVDWFGARRHAAQVYEILGAVVILGVIWPGRKKYMSSGLYFLNFILLSAAMRLFLEAFRGDSPTFVWGLRVAQLIAWLILATGFWLSAVRVKASSAHPEEISSKT